VLKAEVFKQLKGERKPFSQRRYYDFNVLTHRKYGVNRNPVRRGLVQEPQEWAGRASITT